MSTVKDAILNGETSLGIELGSTRIKAVLVDGSYKAIAVGNFDWENQLHDGIWTYPLSLVWKGLQGSFASLKEDVKEKYGVELTKVGSIGISAMMHGYLVFDKDGKQLVPFRTWRNTITGEASRELTELFQYNIPQRWSIAHLYQAILNGEEHVPEITFMTTLAGYIHIVVESKIPDTVKKCLFELCSGLVIFGRQKLEQVLEHTTRSTRGRNEFHNSLICVLICVPSS